MNISRWIDYKLNSILNTIVHAMSQLFYESRYSHNK